LTIAPGKSSPNRRRLLTDRHCGAIGAGNHEETMMTQRLDYNAIAPAGSKAL
jgi:hypothetical protein